ncbi:MAG: hypothetical protein AB1410_04510, partial [Acidobacteriota bacterium]
GFSFLNNLKLKFRAKYSFFTRHLLPPYIDSVLFFCPMQGVHSPVILGYDLKKDSEEDVKKPFKIDQSRIYPSIENIFSQKDKLIIFTQIKKKEGYEENVKLVLKIENSEKILWRKDVDISDTPSLLNIFESLSLEKFSPGKYKLSVSLLKGKNQIDSKEKEFSIQKEPVPRQWILSKIWK